MDVFYDKEMIQIRYDEAMKELSKNKENRQYA